MNAIYIHVDVGVCIKIFIMLKSWRCMCTNVCPWPLCRQSQPEKKKIKNCGVLSLKMAQRAHGHMQPILFLLTDMEIVLNKIWVFLGSIGRVKVLKLNWLFSTKTLGFKSLSYYHHISLMWWSLHKDKVIIEVKV